MRGDYIDFHRVADEHLAIHARLLNWALWVKDHHETGWVASPMWRQVKSLVRQWHMPEYRESCDLLDAYAIERHVALLPSRHRDAIRWFYVFGEHPRMAAKLIGLSKQSLLRHLVDGRKMLKSRLSL